MLSISHATTGAFIATHTHPVVAVPLILASHYLEDWVPHWDVGTGLSDGRRSRQTALTLEVFDLIAAAALVFFLWQWDPSLSLPEQIGRLINPTAAAWPTYVAWSAWLGAFVGLLPDFLEFPRNFLNYEPSFLRPLNDLHHAFHESTHHIWIGLIPQIVLVGVIAALTM
jgi:hypothetical protein